MKAKYLFPSDYMADPSANVFNNRLYIYPSHDWDAGECFDDDGGHFQMKDYHVLSWDDVENDDATDHGVILDVKDVPWAEKQMWDNDVVEKDGKYYLIFSAKGYDGVFRLGVAVADKPEGPFKPMEQPIRGSFSIDPCAFKDDNGEIYVYFGGLWGGQLQWWNPLYHGFETIPGKYGDQTHAALMAAVAEDDAGQQAMTETQPEPEQEQPIDGQTTIRVLIKSSGGKVNIRTGNGTSYSRITAVAPGTTLEYVASAFNGWQAVKIGSQVGWVSGEFSEITTE